MSLSMEQTDDQPTRLEFQMSDGVCLRAEGYGEPSRPGVLLAHGGGQTRYAWVKVAQRLQAKGWYAVAVDLRGHGESDWADDKNYTHARFGADLVEVARSFDAPPVLVGASLGGNAGLLATGTFGVGAFRALVLVDITPRVDEKGVKRILDFLDKHVDEGFANFEEAAAAISGYLPDRKGRQSNLSSLERYLRKRPDGRWRWHWDPAFVQGVQSTRMSQTVADEIADAARNVAVPVLLLRGSESELVNDAAVADFRQLVPHMEFVDVQDAGHMIVGDSNDIFAATLDEFLGRLNA